MAKPCIKISSSLTKRILSAVVLAPIFLYAIISGAVPFMAWLGIAFIISTQEWFNLSKKTEFFIPVMVSGLLYMAISYSSFFALREVYSLNVVLLFIGMIWMSDIGAYFTGKIIGGPKLIQQVSPNKTWSGFGGALFFPAVFAVIWVQIFGLHAEFNDNSWFVLSIMSAAFGVVAGSVGQAGDLLVSFIKRQANVKDTGNIIPGHGGLLDRIDSMLLAAPVFLVLMTLFSYVL